MKRNSSFLEDSIKELKRLDPDISKEIEIVNDSFAFLSHENSIIGDNSCCISQIEKKEPFHVIKGVLVAYDITHIHHDEGPIGSPTQVICTRVSVPKAEETILQDKKEATVRNISKVERKTVSYIEHEIVDINEFDKENPKWKCRYDQCQSLSSFSMIMTDKRLKTLNWLVDISSFFCLSTEVEILAMTLYNAYQTLSPNTQLIAAACLHKACVVLKQQSPSLSTLSDVSLCSYTDQDLVGIEEKMESPSIPLLYSTLCDIHHSIQSSSLLIFASFYFLECSLIRGDLNDTSIPVFCQHCIQVAAEHVGVSLTTEWEMNPALQEHIRSAPSFLIQNRCKALYGKYHSRRRLAVASLWIVCLRKDCYHQTKSQLFNLDT